MGKKKNSEVEEKDSATQESSNSFESEAFNLSSSVISARDEFSGNTPISAAGLTRGIL